MEEVYRPENSSRELQNLKLSHPAIFIVEYALAQTLIEIGIIPDLCIGVSLGEYVALALAGCVSVTDALFLINRQTELIENKCEYGCMITVLHDINLFHENRKLDSYCEIIGINTVDHFVIACSKRDINIVESELKKNRYTYFVLPVSYSFHTSSLDCIKDRYIELLEQIDFSKCRIKFSLASQQLGDKNHSSTILWDSIRTKMNFREALLYEYQTNNTMIDLTPSSTLKNVSNKILNGIGKESLIGIISPFGLEQNDIVKTLLKNCVK